MHYAHFTTTDGCPLAYQTSLPLPSPTTPDTITTTTQTPSTTAPKPDYTTCILLLHGFSGSSAYFTRNFPALSATQHWILAPDMRGHGRSGHNPARGGYHVSRLAADLRELLVHVASQTPPGTKTRVVPVGCSIGAAVVWTYLELFGEHGIEIGEGRGIELAGYVFVDQAPLQDRNLLPPGEAWDERFAHRGCFDEETMLAAQRAWVERPEETHRGLVAECLGYRFSPLPGEEDKVGEEQRRVDEEFFTGISKGCDGVWLARLLADHTRFDHREACEGITKPVRVMAGRRSGCFSLEGMEETVRRVKKGGNRDAEMMMFESGHWLFYEGPERFNRELLGFVERCTR